MVKMISEKYRDLLVLAGIRGISTLDMHIVQCKIKSIFVIYTNYLP